MVVFVGSSPAVVLSSALFGLAHFPFFGFSSLVEAVLGGAFATSFVFADRNLLVPILVHCLYDFAAIYFTWLGASKEINQRVEQAQQQLRSSSEKGMGIVRADSLSEPDPLAFNTLSKMLFEFLDVDKDGVIDRKDFNTGLILLGVTPLPLGRQPKFSEQLFDEADSNKDGIIDFNEFMAVSRNVLGKWLTML